jgi:hypothetical protein
VKVVPDKVGYMMLGNLFKLNEDHYALTDEFGMINCIGKHTGKCLGFSPEFLNANKVNLFIFIPKMIFRFMDLFEWDEKGKEKIEKYFNEPGRNEFKVTILIPTEMESFIQGFNKEIGPLYKLLVDKETLGNDLQEKFGEEYSEKLFKKEILRIQM